MTIRIIFQCFHECRKSVKSFDMIYKHFIIFTGFLDLSDLERCEIALSEAAANREIQNLQSSGSTQNVNFGESANLEAANFQECTNLRAGNNQTPADLVIANSERPVNLEAAYVQRSGNSEVDNFQGPANLKNRARLNSSSPVRVSYVYSRRGKKLVLTESGFTYSYHAKDRLNRMHWVCSTHYSRGCRADVRIRGDIILEERNTHKHRPRSSNWSYERPMNYLNFIEPLIPTTGFYSQ